MTKAEECAIKYYPHDKFQGELGDSLRFAVMQGYEQALQDNNEIEREMCTLSWWEERGWIMIPPNVTLKGIEGLLLTVRDKIKWNERNGVREQLPSLTIEDIERLHTFLYAVKNNKSGCFTFTRLSDEQYGEVLRRFNEQRNGNN